MSTRARQQEESARTGGRKIGSRAVMEIQPPRMRLVLARMQPVASMIAMAVCMRLFGLCLRLRLDRGITRHCRGACATVSRMWWEEV